MNDGPVIPYGRQSISEDDIAAVVAVLRGDWLTQGPAVGIFERELAGHFGAPNVVAVNSGTAALHLGMLGLGIGSGDLVIVPPITFAASANAALYCGAEVAFVDVEPDTALIDVDALEAFLDGFRGAARPRAVVAVHYAGLPCDMRRLVDVCRARGLLLIEDACHAPGASWTAQDGAVHTVGAADVSAFAAFSFHPVKHLTTGEGGAVLTGDPALAGRVEMLRSHGITRSPALLRDNEGPWWYEMQALGFNYRLPDILAALGTSQLGKFDQWLVRRRQIAEFYRQTLTGLPGLHVPPLPPARTHAYHLFPVLVDDRPAVFRALGEQGIRAQVHYIPVHRLPFYRERYGDQKFPVAERWYAREISLPMFPAMSDADVETVCAALAAVAV